MTENWGEIKGEWGFVSSYPSSSYRGLYCMDLTARQLSIQDVFGSVLPTLEQEHNENPGISLLPVRCMS